MDCCLKGGFLSLSKSCINFLKEDNKKHNLRVVNMKRRDRKHVNKKK